MSNNNVNNANVDLVFGHTETKSEVSSMGKSIMKHTTKAVQTVQHELNVTAKFGQGLYNMVKANQPKHAERAKAEVADILAEFFL